MTAKTRSCVKAAVTSISRVTPVRTTLLQRKCACGGTPGATDEFEEWRRKRRVGPAAHTGGHNLGRIAVGVQPKLTINQPGDRFEQEADRMADYVVDGNTSTASPSLSPIASAAVQREDAQPTAPKPNNYDEAVKKILEALQETEAAKQLKAKAAELGKDFLSSVEGKVIAGSALGGVLAGIIATNSELPMQVPELPLDFIAPGLKAKLTWEGPVRSPTNVGLALTSKGGVSVAASYSNTPAGAGKPAEQEAGLALTIPLGSTPAKPKSTQSEGDKYRAETARMVAEQSKFREGLKTPDEKAEDKAFLDSYWRMKASEPLNPLARPGVFAPLERKKEEDLLQRKSPNESWGPATAPPIVNEALADSGQPLDAATREFMEQRFGYDFGHVRIHTDAKAAESARAVNAYAYTFGHDVVFRAGCYSPGSGEGQKLIAHELTHVLQQNAGSATAKQLQRKPAPGPASPTLEESDKSWIKAFGLRKWLKGIISDWEDIQARYEAATPTTFHPTEALLMGILTASRSRIDLGEEQIKTELNGDPALLKEFRDAYRKMISVVVPKFASLTGKTATEVFQAHRQEIPEWALPATTGAPGGTVGCKTLSFADFKGTPPQGATKVADTEYDYTPKTLKPGDTVTAVFDSASSWAQPRYARPTDRKATGLDKKVSDCENFLKKNPGGSWDGPTATTPICPAAAPFPNTAGIMSVADCDAKIGVAIEKWQSAESPRVLKHEQFHMNLACTLADKATKALASGKDPGTVGARLMAQDKAVTGDYDNDTNHGCKAAEQTKWEGLITGGLTKYPVP